MDERTAEPRVRDLDPPGKGDPMRTSMSFGWLFTIIALAGCGGSSASEEPDVIIAPRALVEELARDRAGATARYDGQLLELSGTVGGKVEPGGLNPTIGIQFAGIDDRLAFDAGLSFVRFDPEDGSASSEFEGLDVGDQVTLLCRFEALNASGSLFAVKECRVTS
jgi:hypothetical protein